MLVSSLWKVAKLPWPMSGMPVASTASSEGFAGGHAQPLVVDEGALALFGEEEIVVGRIIDDGGDDGALALQRDRHRKVRHPVQEVGGAVERIDDPDVGLVGALDRSRLLHRGSRSPAAPW